MADRRGSAGFARVLLGAAAVLFACSADSHAQQEIRSRGPRHWKTLKTENFEVHYCDDEILESVREVGQWAENAYAKIGNKLGVKLTRTAPIFVYRSQNDFQQSTVFPGGIPEGVSGVTEFYQDRIVVPLFGSEKFMQRLIEHEFTHQLYVQDYYPWKIPSYLLLKEAFIPDWFAEGLAEWAADAYDTDEIMLMRDAVLDDRMRHLYNLHGFGHLNPHEIQEGYQTGNFALRYIEEKYGAGSVKKLYQNWGGFPWPASRKLAPITKKSYSAFDAEFRAALRKRFIEEAAGKTEPGAYAVPLTENESYYRRWNMSPRVSPDGKRVAYLSDRSKSMSVDVVDIDGRHRVATLLLTVNSTLEFVDRSHSGVTWSPDGKELAFVAEWGQKKDVYVTDPGALGGVRRLKFDFEEMSSPAWSPDGKTIAFSGLDRGKTDIWLGEVGTGKVKRLTKDHFHDDHPCWSPDGRSVAYASERGGQTDLYLADAATGETVPLMETGANERTPAFSPDGKLLAYASDEGGIWNIWLKELEGGKVRRLTDVPGGALSPSFGADGALVFAYYRHGEYHLWKMTLRLEEGEWGPVPVTPPRDWYRDLAVKPVEEYEVGPLNDRWHLDYLMPLIFTNGAIASTLTGKQLIVASADLVGTMDGLRVAANVGYRNIATPIGFVVDVFNVYSEFEERGVDREEHQFGFLAGAIVPLDPYRWFTVGYTLYENRIKFEDEDLHNTDPRNGAVVVALTHNNVTGRGINPSGGFSATGGVAWYRDFFGSQEIRNVYFWRYRQYIEIWEDLVVALGSTGHISTGRDADVQDVAGVVRGYRANRHEGRNVCGASAEIRFPIWRDVNWSMPGQIFLLKDMRGYVFGDAGFATDDGAYLPMRHSGHPDWRHSVGGGLRVDLWLMEKLPVPITLEVAQPTDSHQRVKFTVGVGLSF
ncbi:MAG: PD40 domain-containing protein [Planctomycetes bacterium]|nr:PD40 domain-containing protein [Planctomycetota bacterium]